MHTAWYIQIIYMVLDSIKPEIFAVCIFHTCMIDQNFADGLE